MKKCNGICVAVSLFCAVIVAMVIGLWATGAVAQGMPCGPAEQVIASISEGEKYHEQLFLEGTTESGAPLAFYWDPKGKTASVLIYPRAGVACIMIGGKDVNPTKAAPAKAKPSEEKAS